MLRVGLTGGIASGKTLVTGLFERLGAPVVDADVVSREVVEPGEPALAEIGREFGPEVMAADGRLDRRALRSLVFADPAARRRLEAILHPRIRERLLARLEAIEREGAAYAVVAVPLLVETDFAALVDRVLVVDCPRETQRRRLMARDGLDEREADAMIDAQTDRATRLAAADDVVDNSGEKAATRGQVERLHALYLSLSTDVCPPNSGRAE